jgi:hypothetical protein
VTDDLTHDEARDMLAAAALDALSGDEQAAVLRHASTCAECGPALDALREATSQLAYTAPAVDDQLIRARVRSRLLARAHAGRAAADLNAAASDIVRAQRRTWLASTAAGWTAAALMGIAAVIVVAVLNSRAGEDARTLALSRATDSIRIAQLEDSVSTEDSTLRELTGQQVSILQLTSGAPRAPWAWMFWNHATNHWTFVAHNLPPAAAGKTYQLWLVTPKAKISAGTFAAMPNGSAEVHATYPMARDSLRAIAVTEEPAGGVPQPTGAFVITVTVTPGQ